MCKTIRNIFDKKLTFESLLQAHERASLGKKTKKEIILFEMDLETNLIRILNEIKCNKYKVGEYRQFIVYEPKERIIKSLPYKDRIIHQWYIYEFIKPFFEPQFIKDTYACLDNKGTHLASKTVQKYMRKMQKKYGTYYILKCDIKKFFYNIDIDILLKILNRKIKDKKLLEFTKILLHSENKKGLPIGNYTSQFFANIYLNELDQYVKHKLKVKYYVRYMDDFILFLPNKQIAKKYLNLIKIFLTENLELELNKKTGYFKNKAGCDFCGYRVFETHKLCRKRFKKKFKKNIRVWNKLYDENKLDLTKMNMSLNSFLSHLSHSNSYNYINKYIKEIKAINE